MKILYDYHMHSEISPDAHFSMEAMCESALKNGMREIAFTDHYEFYVNGVVRPWFNERYVEKYFETLEECRKKFEGRLSISLTSVRSVIKRSGDILLILCLDLFTSWKILI